jgi:hypothetical protein
MNRDATRKLQLDRRLIHRRGWISKTELEKQLAELPDVSDKIAPPEDDASADGGSAASGATEPPRVG